MKKIIGFCSLLILATMAYAQKATIINGSVDSERYQRVVLYKVINGRPLELASVIPDSKEHFYFKFIPEYKGFYILGPSDIRSFLNTYTFYFKGGEELNVSLLQGDYNLSGKNTKENMLLEEVYRKLKPLEDQTIYRKALSTYVDFFPQVEKIWTELEILKMLKSGNPDFDQIYPKFINFSMANLAIGYLFTPRMAHPSKEEYTTYYNSFDANKFLTDDLLLFPFGDYMISSLLYMKIPPQQKASIEEMVNAIPSNLVKGEYVLKRMEAVRSYVEYLELASQFERYITLGDQKKRFEAISLKLADTKPGGQVIPFAFSDVIGREISLASLRGKVVLIDLWATWCGPCKSEEPFWEKLNQEFKDKDVAFIGLSVDQNRKTWEKYVNEKKLKGIQLYAGPANVVSTAYKISGIPRYILIDKQGNIISPDCPRPSSGSLSQLIDKWSSN